MSDEKKIHLADGNIHVFGGNQLGKSSRTSAERSAFLIGQLEAQMAKTQTAAKFLAAKLDKIAQARTVFAAHVPEPQDPPTPLDQFLAVLDDALGRDFPG